MITLILLFLNVIANANLLPSVVIPITRYLFSFSDECFVSSSIIIGSLKNTSSHSLVSTSCFNLFLFTFPLSQSCLLYTSDAADDLLCVDLGGRRIIQK